MKYLYLAGLLVYSLFISGCAQQDTSNVKIIGFEWYRLRLPQEVSQNATIDSNRYQSFRFRLDNNTYWLFEPYTDSSPMVVSREDGTILFSLPDATEYQSLVSITKNKRTVLLLSCLAYRNEPIIHFIGVEQNGSLFPLDEIGGEEWRSRSTLTVAIRKDKLIITGITPQRFQVNSALTDYLQKMDVQLLMLK